MSRPVRSCTAEAARHTAEGGGARSQSVWAAVRARDEEGGVQWRV